MMVLDDRFDRKIAGRRWMFKENDRRKRNAAN